MPPNNKIKKVIIYRDVYICGFSFYFGFRSEWKIGKTAIGQTVKETIDISDNEVIVGFKAKSSPECPAAYTEWQFITAR